jgi:hypothetical protein
MELLLPKTFNASVNRYKIRHDPFGVMAVQYFHAQCDTLPLWLSLLYHFITYDLIQIPTNSLAFINGLMKYNPQLCVEINLTLVRYCLISHQSCIAQDVVQ